MTRSPSPARSRSRSSGQAPPLSDLDLRVLALLSRHRVLTQNQLAALVPTTPPRTLRYRCVRLARHGLAGRTRPYRERGSAPHHLWPTRKGEALACGGPPPRGGERHEPNPLFLAHAVGLSETYLALETTLPSSAKLRRFEREAEAREPFTTQMKREWRAIAPDAFAEIEDADGGALLALIELDMGTMSHRRLKQKASGYAEYARAEAWRQRHRFCPALIFITTTEKRARSFLAAMEKELGRDAPLLTCACDLARGLKRIATEPRWLLAGDGDAVNLLAALREARRPYDEERERIAAQRRDEDAERKRLRSDPEALRSHLRRWEHRDWGIGRLGEQAATALALTLKREDRMGEAERRALLALGTLFADPLHLRLSDREPSTEERSAFAALAEHARAAQLGRVADLAGRFGEGPALREARGRLEGGELLSGADASWLESKAADDKRSRAKQEHLGADYLTWRARKAQRLFKAQGFTARLRSDPEDFFDEIDQRSLRRCRSCGETAYPDPEGARGNVALRCHFCGGDALAEIHDGWGAR